MKKIIKILLILGLFFVFAGRAQAADLTITCGDSGCSPETISTLFEEENIYPGWETSSPIVLEVINSYSEDIEFSIRPDLTSEDSILQEVLMLTVGSKSVDLDSDEFQNISIIPTGESAEFDLAMKMEETAGNKYQDESVEFDLTLNFEADEAVEAEPTNTPTPVPTVSGDTTADSTADSATGGILGTLVGASDEQETPPAAEGFEEGAVEGEETEPGQIEGGEQAVTEEVKGEITEQRNCFWWLLGLLGLAINSIYVYRHRHKMAKEKRRWIIPAVVSILAFVGDRIAHQWFVPSNYCSFMWLISLLGFILPLVMFKIQWNK